MFLIMISLCIPVIHREVLQNTFHALSRDNWNQTLRKSKVFHQSWAKQKMRTKYDGHYEDQVMAISAAWKKGEEPTLQEVGILKL